MPLGTFALVWVYLLSAPRVPVVLVGTLSGYIWEGNTLTAEHSELPPRLAFFKRTGGNTEIHSGGPATNVLEAEE